MRHQTQLMAATVLLTLMVTSAVVLTVRHFSTTGGYERNTTLTTGTHVTLVLLAPTGPPDRAYVSHVVAAKDAVRDLARESGYFFTTVGISDMWNPTRGVEQLARFGDFDEIIAGRNWLNTGIKAYIDDLIAPAAVPQVIVTCRDVVVDAVPYQYGPMIELVRVLGRTELRSWAQSGFPVQALPKCGHLEVTENDQVS